MLNLSLQQTELSAGDHLSGRVIWTGSNQPKDIQLTIGWRTEGRGTVDAEKVHLSLINGDSFNHLIPCKGPYSYDGQLIRIIWEITAIAEMGSRGKESTVTKTFRVLTR
jgi:hypothetical protein